MKCLLVHNYYQSKNVGGEDGVFEREKRWLTSLLGAENVFSYSLNNDAISKRSLFKLFYNSNANQAIKKLIYEQDIDIVHFHNEFPLLGASAFKAAKQAGAITVQSLHNYRKWCLNGLLYNASGQCTRCVNKAFKWPGVLQGCFRNNRLQSLVSACIHTFHHIKAYHRYIDQYWALSPSQFAMLKKIGLSEERLTIKANGIQVPAFPNCTKKGFIYVGRLEEAKGIELVLSNWQHLGTDFKLTVIGTGPNEEELKTRFKADNIQFIGKQSHTNTLKYIHQAQYLIQPSLCLETFGLTLLEAMSLGTPVIGFNIGTRMDFIQDGINGWHSKTNELKAVVEKAQRSNNYQAMSANALKFASDYEARKVTIDQISLYKELLNGRST